MLELNGVTVTQSTLSRDIKLLNLVKVNDDASSYYMVNPLGKRLRLYVEDALIILKPVQHQVVLKTLPGLASSFGSILDAMEIPEIVATLCGDDVCLIICQDNQAAQTCYGLPHPIYPTILFIKGIRKKYPR